MSENADVIGQISGNQTPDEMASIIQRAQQDFETQTADQQPEFASQDRISGIEPEQLRNYANDSDIVYGLKREILEYVKLARSNRESKIEQDWLRYRDIYNMRRTVAYYDGRSKLFLPAVRKSIDVLTRIAKDAIFSDPYIGIETDVPKYRDVALDLMTWLLEDQARFKEKMAMFLRQLYQIGTSCLKITWQKKSNNIKYREFDPEIGQTVIRSRTEFEYYGPKIDVVDMRHIYVWPESATDYDGLRLVFENSTITHDEAMRLAGSGLFDKEATIKALQRKSSTLEAQRKSEGQASREGIGDASYLPRDVLDITYIWAKFKLPGQTEPQWNQIIMLNLNDDDIVRVAENPWWFQRPNYLFGSLFQEHDYFYGHGIIEMLEMWQYMINDIANHSMDTATFTLNPIVVYDPGMVDDPDHLELQPMAKWAVPPKSIDIIRPPIDMMQSGLSLLQFLITIVQEGSDATALVQGAPRIGLGSATSTATGVSQLFAASNSAILDQVDALQSQVLTPLLHYIEIMVHEFLDEAMLVRKVGQDGIVLTQRVIRPQDLALSLDVRWIASNRLREKAAKVQQLINFFNIATRIPPQITLRQGFEFDYKEIVKDIYSGLGLADTDRIIRDTTVAVPGILPDFEEELLNAGRSVYASPVDTLVSHQAHIQHHMQFRPKSELARTRMTEHLANHYHVIQQIQAQFAQQPSLEGNGQPVQNGKGGPDTALQLPGSAPGVRPQEQAQSDSDTELIKGLMSQVGGQ